MGISPYQLRLSFLLDYQNLSIIALKSSRSMLRFANSLGADSLRISNSGDIQSDSISDNHLVV